MGGGIIMTRYSNYEIDILKPSMKEIKRMRAFAKYRGWSIWVGTSIGVKRLRISGQTNTEDKASDKARSIIEDLPGCKKKIRVSIKSYWGWDEKCGQIMR